MQEGAASAGVQPQDVVEGGAGQVAVRPGAPERLEEIVFLPLAGDAGGDGLLRQDVERRRSVRKPIEHPLPDALEERGALHELVESQRKEPSLGNPRQGVAGPADPLQERRDRSRGPDLDDEVHVADVDAELEGRRRDEGAQAAGLEALLGVQPPLPREAAVMARHEVLAEALGELPGEAFGHLARVHENERGAVGADELVDPGVDLVPLFVGADRGERGGRHLDREVELPEAPGVDDTAIPADAGEETTDLLQRLLRGREADALERAPGQCLQALEREGEMASALVAIEGVDLVHDDRPDGRTAFRARRRS